MSGLVYEGYSYKQLSATANIKPSSGILQGIFVSAASSTPKITIYDSASTGTSKLVVAEFAPTAGTFYKMPFGFSEGLYVVISGTVEATVAFQ